MKFENLFFVLLLASIASTANADSTVNYNYLGTMSFTSFSNAAVTETISFDFQLDYSVDQNGNWTQSLATPSLISSSGPVAGISSIYVLANEGYIEFANASGDQFDLGITELSDTAPPVTPIGTYVYACYSQSCQDNFAPYHNQIGVFYAGTENVLVTEVPEPPTVVLFLSGILFFALALTWRSRSVFSA